MRAYLKKNQVHIYLLLVIAGLVSLPVISDGKAVVINLATAIIAYGCLGRIFGNRELGLLGSMLYTWCPYRWSDGNPAWVFVPIVLWGIVSFYGENQVEKDRKRSWLILTAGLGLLAFSSVTLFCIIVVSVLLFFCLMGKESFCKEKVLSLVKTLGVSLVIGGYPLVSRLLQLRDPAIAGSLIPDNFRMSGAYPAQYLGLFSTAEEGAKYPELGMGAAVLFLVLLYLWGLFTGKIKDSFGKKILLWILVLLWMGSNLFPWDLLQNKNLLFSIVLAVLQSPITWVIPAYGALVWVACRVLQKLRDSGDEKLYKTMVAVTVLVAFVMNRLG